MNTQDVNGNKGGDYIADTAAHVPPSPNTHYRCLQIEADAVLDPATICNINGLAASGATLPAGKLYFGSFANVKLASGILIAYYA